MTPKIYLKSKLIVIFIVFVFVSFAVNSCRPQETIAKLEVVRIYSGNYDYHGDFLIIRVLETGTVEYDCLRNYNEAISSSNIVSKRSVLSKDDMDEFRTLTDKLSLIKSFNNKVSNEKWSDGRETSSINYLDIEGKPNSMSFNGDFLKLVTSSTQPSDEASTLKALIDKIKTVREEGCISKSGD